MRSLVYMWALCGCQLLMMTQPLLRNTVYWTIDGHLTEEPIFILRQQVTQTDNLHCGWSEGSAKLRELLGQSKRNGSINTFCRAPDNDLNLQLFQDLRKNKDIFDYTETCLLLFYAFLSFLNELGQRYFLQAWQLGIIQ